MMSLLDEYEVKLTHYAHRILGDVELARDVVQQTFLKLCDVSDIEKGDHTAAWLYTVCRNQALDELRCHRRTWQPGRRSGCKTRVARDLFERLKKIVRRLPDSQREVIDLWADGLSLREISQITQNSEDGVRMLVHRAINRLREHPQVSRWTNVTSESNGRASSISRRQAGGLHEAERTT